MVNNASICITQDYNLFKSHFYNRSLQKTNLVKLKESISRNNLLSVNPIICIKSLEGDGTTLDIIDGFHRFNVAKELKIPVHYVILENFDIQMLIDLNFSLSKWGPFQFLELYCKMGKEEYLKFKKFQNDFNLDIFLALPLTKKRDFRRKLSEDFRKGQFVFDNEEQIRNKIKCAMEFLLLAKELLLFKPNPHKDLAFFDGYSKLMDMEEFNQEVMMNKLKKFGLTLLESASMTGYYTQLSCLLKKSK